jgi:glyoxylase-like metal-dependent hydrolase (beta-lactamase superfamily II)
VTQSPIQPTGGWAVALLEIGRARHPGEWVGPGFPEWMWTPMNSLLLQRPDQTILIDTGSGVLTYLWPFEGIVSDTGTALAAAGVQPAEIDLVVLTHLDDDHIGGLLTGAWPHDVALAFPRARVVVPRAGVQAVAAGEGLPAGNEERRRLVEIVRGAGVLHEVGPGEEVADGIWLRDAPGHRAGHMCVEIGGERPLIHLADTLHHLAHVEHPEWDGPADDDPALALVTRNALLADLAATGTGAVASHLPGPGTFTISPREGGGFAARTVAW